MAAIMKLDYSKDNGRLTLQQRVFYEKYGYLVFKKLVPLDILKKCNDRYNDIVSGKLKKGGITVMYDIKDKKSVNKIQDISRDEVFRTYCQCNEVLDIVEGFTGPNIIAVHSMLIAKPPDIGFGSSKHPPHQDLYYFPFRPANLIVASWTAMERCSVDNGCLYVSPGSHRRNHLFKHDYPANEEGVINKFYHGIQDLPEKLEWVNLEMEPGDTVFFHPLLIHGSGVNVSNRDRRAISCHYAASECEYVNVTDTIQNRIEEEVLGYLRKRYPDIELTYKDVWQIKSVLVRGMRSSL